MKGITCNYKVSNKFDAIRCQGKGHVAMMHKHIVDEQLKRGAKTDPKWVPVKGVTGARGPRQPGAATRPGAKAGARGKPAARRPGAPSTARSARPKGNPKRSSGRPTGTRTPGKRRERARVAGEETEGEDVNDEGNVGGEDQDEQTEDEGQADATGAEPVDVGGEEATEGEQTEDDNGEDDQDDGYDQDGNLIDVEPGGLAANYDPRQLRTLDNVGPYAGFDLDSFFPGRFAEPGQLMTERVLMFRGARPADPTSEGSGPSRGRSRQAAAARPDRKDERPPKTTEHLCESSGVGHANGGPGLSHPWDEA